MVRLAVSPLAGCEALQELKELIHPIAGVGLRVVVQAKHQSLSRTGGSDATRNEVIARKTTSALSSTGRNASLGESPTRVRRQTLALLVRWLRAHARDGAQGVREEVRDE